MTKQVSKLKEVPLRTAELFLARDGPSKIEDGLSQIWSGPVKPETGLLKPETYLFKRDLPSGLEWAIFKPGMGLSPGDSPKPGMGPLTLRARPKLGPQVQYEPSKTRNGHPRLDWRPLSPKGPFQA